MMDFDSDIPIFFDEFADDAVYKRGDSECTVKAVITKQKNDEEDESSMLSEAVIFISDDSLKTCGFESPEMYDEIGTWIVQSSRYENNLWEINAYSNVKMNP